MIKPSKYMQRLFKSQIGPGIEFWSGEDGEPLSFVAPFGSDGLQKIAEYCISKGIHFDKSKVKTKYAYRGTVDDCYFGEGVRVVWMTTWEETPFKVFEYEFN